MQQSTRISFKGDRTWCLTGGLNLHCPWRWALTRGRQMMPPCRSSNLAHGHWAHLSILTLTCPRSAFVQDIVINTLFCFFFSSVDGMRMVIKGFVRSFGMFVIVFAACAGANGICMFALWFLLLVVSWSWKCARFISYQISIMDYQCKLFVVLNSVNPSPVTQFI